MPPDSSAVVVALLAALNGDGALLALTPDKAYLDVAPSGATRYVVISLLIGRDEPMQGGRAYEEEVWQVKAVIKSNSTLTAMAAAARIDLLLDQQPLAIAGYAHMLTRRIEPVALTETDSLDKDIKWQHRGGRYEIFVSGP